LTQRLLKYQFKIKAQFSETENQLDGSIYSYQTTNSSFECLALCIDDQNCFSVETSLNQDDEYKINCLFRNESSETSEKIEQNRQNFILKG
jgi:hypothetical protein